MSTVDNTPEASKGSTEKDTPLGEAKQARQAFTRREFLKAGAGLPLLGINFSQLAKPLQDYVHQDHCDAHTDVSHEDIPYSDSYDDDPGYTDHFDEHTDESMYDDYEDYADYDDGPHEDHSDHIDGYYDYSDSHEDHDDSWPSHSDHTDEEYVDVEYQDACGLHADYTHDDHTDHGDHTDSVHTDHGDHTDLTTAVKLNAISATSKAEIDLPAATSLLGLAGAAVITLAALRERGLARMKKAQKGGQEQAPGEEDSG